MKRGGVCFLIMLGILTFGLPATDALCFELITETETVVVKDVRIEIVKTADNFVILFATSSSMDELYGNSGLKKIQAMKRVLKERNQNLPDIRYNGGLYTFSPQDSVVRNRVLKPYYPLGPYKKAEFAKAIDQLPDEGVGPTLLQQALTELDEILAPLKGSTVIFVVSDGKFSRVRNMKTPVEIANDLAAKYDVSFYVISNAQGKAEKDLLRAVASVNAYSRVIPLNYLLESPSNFSGALFVLRPRIFEAVITTERIVGVVLNESDMAPATSPAPAPPKPDPEILAAQMSRIHFDFNKSDIRPKYYDGLNLLGKFMQSTPNTMVVFSGFTDSVGDSEYNLNLSRHRAESVGMYLAERFGIDPGRIVLQWYGEAAPVASNDTAEGRRQNRRVETIVAELP